MRRSHGGFVNLLQSLCPTLESSLDENHVERSCFVDL